MGLAQAMLAGPTIADLTAAPARCWNAWRRTRRRSHEPMSATLMRSMTRFDRAVKQYAAHLLEVARIVAPSMHGPDRRSMPRGKRRFTKAFNSVPRSTNTAAALWCDAADRRGSGAAAASPQSVPVAFQVLCDGDRAGVHAKGGSHNAQGWIGVHVCRRGIDRRRRESRRRGRAGRHSGSPCRTNDMDERVRCEPARGSDLRSGVRNPSSPSRPARRHIGRATDTDETAR